MTRNKQPLITIVTVSFNAISTIEQTISSVINQTYPNIEYIIIDGGSTDGTVDIIKKYTDKISYWVSEPDKGIYDAMNKGIHLAKGKWINFMNSGDTLYDNMVIEKVIDKANLDSDIIYGNTNILLSHGEYIIKPQTISSKNYMPFGHQAVFSNTKLMKKYAFDINFKICADKKFFYTAYKNNAKFEYIDINISNYEAEDGVSANNMPQIVYEIGLIEGKTENILWKFYYASFIFLHNIKYIIKKTLPTSFLQHMRKIKYSHKL